MADPTTKLPVKTDKETTPAWAPFDSLRREIDRLFDDFSPFDWRLPSARSMFGFENSEAEPCRLAGCPCDGCGRKGQGI